MDDHKVLQHLLDMEAEAAALVNNAQMEADRKISEGEKQNRAQYDEAYAREARILEEFLARNLADVKENYQKQLDAYREGLESMPVDMKAFSLLAEKFLIPDLFCKEP